LSVPAASVAFFALSGLCEGGAYLLMWRALSLGSVSVVSPLVNAYSIVTIALAAIFLRDLERVTWRLTLAAALRVAGVALRLCAGPYPYMPDPYWVPTSLPCRMPCVGSWLSQKTRSIAS